MPPFENHQLSFSQQLLKSVLSSSQSTEGGGCRKEEAVSNMARSHIEMLTYSQIAILFIEKVAILYFEHCFDCIVHTQNTDCILVAILYNNHWNHGQSVCFTQLFVLSSNPL